MYILFKQYKLKLEAEILSFFSLIHISDHYLTKNILGKVKSISYTEIPLMGDTEYLFIDTAILSSRTTWCID